MATTMVMELEAVQECVMEAQRQVERFGVWISAMFQLWSHKDEKRSNCKTLKVIEGAKLIYEKETEKIRTA